MFRSGAACDPPGRAGLASITAEMLDEGAGARDALGIAAELEQLGADLWLGSGRDGSQLSMQAPRETFPAAMAIAADVLIRPRLEQADWQRVHNDRRTGVVAAPRSARGGGERRRRIGSCSATTTPTASRSTGWSGRSTRSRSTTCARFTPPTTARATRRWSSPATSTRRRCRRSWRRCSAAWKPAPPPPAPRPLPWPSRPRLVIIDRPGAPQSIVRLVAPGTDRFSPDRPGLSMLNAILGGSFTSRLNFNLREKHGYTYGAASSFSFLRHAGSFAARAAVFAESTAPAVREMLSELSGLHERPITTEEHAKAHATLLMRVAEGLSTTGGMAPTSASWASTGCRSTSRCASSPPSSARPPIAPDHGATNASEDSKTRIAACRSRDQANDPSKDGNKLNQVCSPSFSCDSFRALRMDQHLGEELLLIPHHLQGRDAAERGTRWVISGLRLSVPEAIAASTVRQSSSSP